jgi:hypothetical protein
MIHFGLYFSIFGGFWYPKYFSLEQDEEKLFPQVSLWSTTLRCLVVSLSIQLARVLFETFWLFLSYYAKPYLLLTLVARLVLRSMICKILPSFSS